MLVGPKWIRMNLPCGKEKGNKYRKDDGADDVKDDDRVNDNWVKIDKEIYRVISP